MSVSYNPQPFISNYISMMRNVYLTSSVGIAMMVFSDSFKKYNKLVKLLSVSIILYSIVYAYKASNDSNNYINYIEKQENLPKLYSIMLNKWKEWIKITYIYMMICIVLIIVILTRKILI